MDLSQKKLFLLDMDGTLYLDERLFDGAREFLDCVRFMGGRYLFLTNNSSRGVEAYVEKMARMGVDASPEDFLTSVDASIAYLHRQRKERSLLYVFGTESFRAQLRQAGFRVAGSRSDEVDTLLCGFDTELTFQKLEDACILLNRGVDYIATNPDWVCPTWYGSVPDCGSVCEMLRRATGRSPKVIGKPQPEMALLAMERTGYTPEQTLLIGDRIYTDIACGLNAGVDAALVLSGESTLKTVEQSEIRPTAIYEDIREIWGKLRDGR
ncbi:HAD-IIA family hydrolase [Oscillibacter sp. MSJ-2]|uniref:Acid sugar phosphatase n=1 Tax=Dysosmobacter acutus TaxID=2841504 RepID=A0ABS6FCU2_9FIRM|nr:HAD-IIA family hydrolase [Dysosmobacter acutus]MBU5627875.1 HAD-IIA family hydrolase [Dysosmobacter acutus]